MWAALQSQQEVSHGLIFLHNRSSRIRTYAWYLRQHDLANIRRCNILTLHPLANDFGVILYGVCIAIAICYAQIYVGVHYPIDIVCGAILGFSIGYFISLRYNKHFGLS